GGGRIRALHRRAIGEQARLGVHSVGRERLSTAHLAPGAIGRVQHAQAGTTDRGEAFETTGGVDDVVVPASLERELGRPGHRLREGRKRKQGCDAEKTRGGRMFFEGEHGYLTTWGGSSHSICAGKMSDETQRC